MATTENPTTAAEYRAMRQKTKPRQTTLVTLPSGVKWQLAPPDLLGYIYTGRMPESLMTAFLDSPTAKAAAAAGKIDEKKIAEVAKEMTGKLTLKEATGGLIFMREIVSDTCINPRIVPGGVGDNELDPTEVDPEDFRFIFRWALQHSGVAGVGGLQSFRPRRTRRAAASKSGRKGVRRKTERTPVGR